MTSYMEEGTTRYTRLFPILAVMAVMMEKVSADRSRPGLWLSIRDLDPLSPPIKMEERR